MKKKIGKSENDKWQRRKWGGSFPLLDHMVDGNPKEKMKEKRKRKRKIVGANKESGIRWIRKRRKKKEKKK